MDIRTRYVFSGTKCRTRSGYGDLCMVVTISYSLRTIWPS